MGRELSLEIETIPPKRAIRRIPTFVCQRFPSPFNSNFYRRPHQACRREWTSISLKRWFEPLHAKA
jgi:hypothetical protein